MKKEIEAFVNAANEQELEAAWNLSLIHISAAAGCEKSAEILKSKQFIAKKSVRCV